MTEAEWLDCTDPPRMLEFLRGRTSDRKLRLVACACCRRDPTVMASASAVCAVEMAEMWVDGKTTTMDLSAVLGHREAYYYEHETLEGWGEYVVVYPPPLPIEAVVNLTRLPVMRASQRYTTFAAVATARAPELRWQSNIVRDSCGNPFRPVSFDPSWVAWNDGAVRKLAQIIYDDRAFDRLPILADALEEAGCTESVILDHCRNCGEHVRGCWVVDLLLGKS